MNILKKPCQSLHIIVAVIISLLSSIRGTSPRKIQDMLIKSIPLYIALVRPILDINHDTVNDDNKAAKAYAPIMYPKM